MKKPNYLLPGMLFISWCLGFFVIGLSYVVHLLLVGAISILLVKLLQERNAESN